MTDSTSLWRIPVTTLGYSHRPVSAESVERFVERGVRYPSAVGVVSAITRVIGAARAFGAWSRASCKRQVSGSIPLTGSQVRRGKCPLLVSIRGTNVIGWSADGAPQVVMDGGGRSDEAPSGNSPQCECVWVFAQSGM